MKVLAGGCRVYSENDGLISTHGNWTARTVISQESGAKHISQTVSDYAAGLSPAVVNPGAEEVLYVIAGEGTCAVNGFEYRAAAGHRAVYSTGRRIRHRKCRPASGCAWSAHAARRIRAGTSSMHPPAARRATRRIFGA